LLVGLVWKLDPIICEFPNPKHKDRLAVDTPALGVLEKGRCDLATFEKVSRTCDSLNFQETETK
jgi:hypothetical protein